MENNVLIEHDKLFRFLNSTFKDFYLWLNTLLDFAKIMHQ